MTTHIEVIKNGSLQGNVFILPPGQLDRKLYQDTAKTLEGIGGKWNKKAGGFMFANDPAELIEEIRTGVKRNLKKEFQFFATPESVGLFMVREAYIKEGDLIGEFSAGDGALIKAARKEGYANKFQVCELDEHRSKLLSKMEEVEVIGSDFLEVGPKEIFDIILLNPPFSKNQDIDHIRHAYKFLKPGARMVTVASKHWQLSGNKKETDFKNWIDEIGAAIYDLNSGAFKESGTLVSTVVLTIDKP